MTSQENIHSFHRVQLKSYCFEIMYILQALIFYKIMVTFCSATIYLCPEKKFADYI